MKGIVIDESIVLYDSIPTVWKRSTGESIHGYQHFTEYHYDDGWRDYVEPTMTDTQRVASHFFDDVNDVFTSTIEDIPQEELDQQAALQSRANRDELLKNGIIVEHNGVNWWFTEAILNNFITLKNEVDRAGGLTISWKAENKQWYDLTIADADVITMNGIQQIQQIYINN